MESIDLLVLSTAHDWLQAGHRVLLATVARTWGSSPRPVGSMMALRGDGRVVGSVSGGCIEDDLIHRYTNAYDGSGLPDGPPQVVRYGISADEAHRFGLPCGGTLELILEFTPSRDALERLLTQLNTGKLVRRSLDLGSGQVSLTISATPEQFIFDGRQMVNTLGPGYRLLLIGAGALAEYLATMALFNGFRVAVCDPAPNTSAAGAWRAWNSWSACRTTSSANSPRTCAPASSPSATTPSSTTWPCSRPCTARPSTSAPSVRGATANCAANA